MIKRFLLALAFLAGLAAPALASQGSGCMPTTGQISGLTFAIDVNAGIDALISSNSGASAPVTACSGASLAGQLWLNTTTSPYVLSMYDGTSWLPFGTVDNVNHRWTPPLGGGTNTVASAATTDLCTSIPQAYVVVSGTTGISSFGSACVTGTMKVLRFSSAGVVLTYNATSMILPTAVNITTQAGDTAFLVSLGGGNWIATNYLRADGTALATASAFGSQISFTGVISPAALGASTNDWAPAGLATASVIRASGSIDLSITGITAQPTGTILIVDNIGSTNLTLSDASGSSSAANRFSFGSDTVLGPSQSIILRYDGTLSRWTGAAAFRNTASQTQATTGTDNATMMTPLRTAQAISALASSAGTDYQPFTTNGTWTKTSGTTASSRVLIEEWGAGGGGGTNASSGGGGGGAYCYLWVLASAMGATETVTVGTGGGTATAGGNSSVGSLLTAYGGGGASNLASSGSAGGGGCQSVGVSSTGGVNGKNGGGPAGGVGSSSNGTNGGAFGGGAGAGQGAGLSGGDGGYGGGGGSGNTGGSAHGGNAYYGGAGGGSLAGGTSVFGGNGGADSVAGSAPAGGGGRNAAGARGEVRITTFK